MAKRISVTNETSSGRNQIFHDNFKNKNMTWKEFVKNIKSGLYKDYHIRTINGIETPVSNPDKSIANNLG